MIINDSLEPYKSLEEWMDRDGITVLVKESGQMRYRLETLSHTRFGHQA